MGNAKHFVHHAWLRRLNQVEVPRQTLLLLVILMWTAGIGVIGAMHLLLVACLVVWPGVIAIRYSLCTTRPLTSLEVHVLGAPLGLIVALLSQQVLVALDLGTFGWLIPSAVAAPLWLSRFQPASTNASASGALRYPILVAALLILADMDWAFLIAGVVGAVGLSLLPKIVPIVITVGLVLTRLVIDDYWYLISDDRLFEDAYSRSIQNFGFWNWYGATDTWVPYHWLAHGVGGLAQGAARIGGFEAVGIVPAIIASLITASSSLLLISKFVDDESQSAKLLLAVPLLGVLVRGVSNSADMSVSLGIWTLALASSFLEGRIRRGPGAAFVILAVVALSLSKVSTALVVVMCVVGMLIVEGIRNQHLSKNLLFLAILGIASATAVALNYDIAGSAVGDDSRSYISVELGGFLGLHDYSRTLALLVTTIALISILFLPMLLASHAYRCQLPGTPIAVGVTAMLAIAWLIRLFFNSYNNEAYAEAAIACSLPVLLGLAASAVGGNLGNSSALTFAVIGASAGFAQEILKLKGTSILFHDAIRLAGLLPTIPYGATIFVLLVVRLATRFVRFRTTSVVAITAVLLTSAGFGGDIYRIALHLQTGTVWAATSFGESDGFFFGTNDEKIAARWITENVDSRDIVATNRVCGTTRRCDLDGQSAIASWTQRRTYLEAERFITGRSVDEVVPGDDVARGHPLWITERKEVSIRFGQQQSEQLKGRLIDQGVRWFWLDLDRNSAEITDDSIVVFQSGKIAILKLE